MADKSHLPQLTFEQLVAALDQKNVEMELPELGGTIKLKALTLDQKDHVLAGCTIDGKVDGPKLMRLLIVHGVVEPKLTIEVVSSMPFAVADRISGKLLELNGMKPEKGASAATVADITF